MTLDLSAVTDSLIGMVKSQWASAPIWTELGTAQPPPNISGLAPDAARVQSGPQLGMYLYHVESDNAQESLFWQPQMLGVAGGEPTRYLPLALDLFYLLFAYSEASYTDEQQAMSVAVRIFHANPVVRSEPGAAVPWELTLTMEHRSYDELSRLWQATTAPLRMSLVYRAAVVFIDPDQMPQAGPQTQAFSVVADPVVLPLPGDYPVLFGVFRDGAYLGPTGVSVPFPQSPATVAAGQTAWLLGSDLGAAGVSDSVYLLPPGGGPETDVTVWAVAADSDAAKFVLTLPTTGGQAPAGAPAPGIYQLRVGSGALGTPGATRSGSIPVSIAAYVDPAAGPMLSGSAPFTVTGAGFVPGETEVLVGTAALAQVVSSPAAGEVSVDPSATSLTFSPPPGPDGTVLPVRIRVSGVESDPALWVTL
ncbi:MAG TPA: Pvc16 family protein [Streptosporangiaceae bacterium]|nr:Pvc16 family protein [Streptosporangiaceae bacterium]